MSITERDRRDLYDGLERTLGPDVTETLLKMLPDEPADRLLTIPYFQTEMAASRVDGRAEMADFRSEIRNGFAEFKAEMRSEIVGLRTEMTSELVDVRGSVLRVENSLSLRIADLHTSMNRWAIALATTNIIALVTALAT